jgi:hypothetical protein
VAGVLSIGESCCWLGPATRSAVIVDACAYYAALYRAASLAQHHIVIAGWQFDSNVKLLRGQAAEEARYPVEFLPFLNALCAERHGLRVYLLAWDYSLVYSLEREWLQGLKFAFQSSDAIRFEFDQHPSFGGSHHQKFAVIDGALASECAARQCLGQTMPAQPRGSVARARHSGSRATRAVRGALAHRIRRELGLAAGHHQQARGSGSR